MDGSLTISKDFTSELKHGLHQDMGAMGKKRKASEKEEVVQGIRIATADAQEDIQTNEVQVEEEVRINTKEILKREGTNIGHRVVVTVVVDLLAEVVAEVVAIVTVVAEAVATADLPGEVAAEATAVAAVTAAVAVAVAVAVVVAVVVLVAVEAIVAVVAVAVVRAVAEVIAVVERAGPTQVDAQCLQWDSGNFNHIRILKDSIVIHPHRSTVRWKRKQVRGGGYHIDSNLQKKSQFGKITDLIGMGDTSKLSAKIASR
ncbi:hypothetical protein J3Q64DRAFT_1856849 [Phycomyces blakesleeanus]